MNLRFYILNLFVLAFLILPWLTLPVNFSAQAAVDGDKKVSAEQREQAYRANNIGVAYLEQFDHKKGVTEFQKALEFDPQSKIAQINLAIALFNAQDLDNAFIAAKTAVASSPSSPQPQYILGLIAKTQNRTEDAINAFTKVLQIDPQDVGANVNLGQIYIQQRKYAEAVAVCRVALDAEPYNSTAMYALATALLRSGDREEGQQMITRFQTLRQSGAATNIGQNYLEQGRYAEAIASTGAEDDLVDKTTPKVVFQNVNVGLAVSKPVANTKKSVENANKRRGATLIDLDNDGDLDLAQLVNGTEPIRLYRNDNGKFTDITQSSGDLAKPLKTHGFGIIAGDYDNDGLADLFVFGEETAQIFHNDGKNGFTNNTVKANLSEYHNVSISAAFVDADHDGDLDIFIAGFMSGNSGTRSAPNELRRNNGDGTFTDISETAKVNNIVNSSISVTPTDYDNRRDIDFLVVNGSGKPNLFRNLRDGSFKDVASEVGLNQSGSWTCAAVGDSNKDTFVDFFFGKADGTGVFAFSDGRGKFVMQNAPVGTENVASAQFLDYDNDGLLDLIVNTDKGFAIVRNVGDGWAKADFSIFKTKTDTNNVKQILSGDIDTDGDIDLITIDKNGNLQYLQNEGGNSNNSEVLRLQGRASNKSGIGAKIDLRSGSLAQKLESYSASPMPAPSQIIFGLGNREKPDAVRVIWASGTVQAEVDFPEKNKNQTAKNMPPFKIEELDRKPSSCPYIYTWNGEKFEFITDFLGGGEMGNWQGNGVFNTPKSDEFVRITSGQLKPKNGRYEIRITNELEEVLFLDKLKLVAVAHDADTEIYPNEGLGIPTVGQQILYTTHGEHAPLSAIDMNGKSVLPVIEKLDRIFYDSFKSLPIRGYAETHDLKITLDDKNGYNGKTLLLLTGWTDYAYSSDNLAASQSGKSQFLPYLQVKNKKDEWQTVIDSIGIAIGRPQTLVVDLTGKFLTDSREVRIVTNFKTFWDKIAVDTSAASEIQKTDIKPAQAELRERGYSVESKYSGMIVPDYAKIVNDGRWKYFAGKFTRTGDVKFLLDQIDDTFVISKTGDEIVLSFSALPELPKNKKYTFLLYADGYSKEMDINSGSPDAVFPLPFKGMTKYPYNADEHSPMTVEKIRIYEEYTTRTVNVLLPNIALR